MAKKASSMTLKVIISFLLIIPLIALLLVRFNNDAISTESSILLDYDEQAEKMQFFEKKEKESLDGIDGPYIIKNKVYRVNQQNEVEVSPLDSDVVWVKANNATLDSFQVHLVGKHEQQADVWELPSKMVVISDIEGNFNAFAGFLQQHQVIDSGFNWIFGNGHLVLVGDFVDRGDNVIPTLWLMYKLEQEAKANGGQVHFILGNHEILNIQGDFKHVLPKYKAIAKEIGKSKKGKANYQLIFSPDSHLGAWMRSKNAIVKIGQYLFVHGGISPEMVQLNLDIAAINKIVSAHLDVSINDISENDKEIFDVMGTAGPMWYRGLVRDTREHKKIKGKELDKILAHYKVEHIIIGHSVVNNISTGYKGKVIMIDVLHGQEKQSPKTQGLLIENKIIYEIDGVGKKKALR